MGSHAYAHYKQGEKANQKANDHAKSSGLYLAEAKRRIDTDHPYGERTKAWEGFLITHCPVKRTRAEQLIAIATGKTTEVEVQEKDRAAKRERRAKASFSGRPEKVQQTLPAPERDGRQDTINRIIKKLSGLSLAQLQDIERAAQVSLKVALRALEGALTPAND